MILYFKCYSCNKKVCGEPKYIYVKNETGHIAKTVCSDCNCSTIVVKCSSCKMLGEINKYDCSNCGWSFDKFPKLLCPDCQGIKDIIQ